MVHHNTHTQLQKMGSTEKLRTNNKNKTYIRQMIEVNLSSVII